MDVPSHYRDGVGIDTDTSSNRPHREAVDVENTRTSSAPNLLKVCTYTPCVLVSRSLRRTDIFEELLINLGVILAVGVYPIMQHTSVSCLYPSICVTAAKPC